MCQLRHCSQESTSEQLHGHKQELAKLDKSLAESTAALEGHKKEFAAHKEATGKGLEAHQQALESHKAETTKSFETQQQALAKHKEEATSQLEAHKKEFAAHKEATGKGLEAHQQALESHKAETTKSFETQQQALAKHKEEATSQLEAHKKEFAAHKEATGKGLEAHQQALESHKAETTKSFETQQQALEIQKKSTAEQIESHKKEVAVTSKQVSTFEKLIASQEEKSLQSLQAAVKELKDELQKMEKSRAAERAEIDQIKKQLELQRSAAAKPGAPAPPAPPVPPKAPPKWWKWWPWWLLAWRNNWALERLSPEKIGIFGRPKGGTSLTIENSDKAIKVIVEQKLRNASVELQLELQRYTSGKKKVLQEILLCVDWQWQSERLFRKTDEALPFGVIFLRCPFLDEWIGTIPVSWNLRANMEWKGTMQSRAQGNFCQKQTTWKERIQKGQTGKEQKSKDWFIHSLVYFSNSSSSSDTEHLFPQPQILSTFDLLTALFFMNARWAFGWHRRRRRGVPSPSKKNLPSTCASHAVPDIFGVVLLVLAVFLVIVFNHFCCNSRGTVNVQDAWFRWSHQDMGIHGAFLWHSWCMMLIRLKTI